MTIGSNPLGTTDRYVTKLGLGLAALGRPGYINLGHGNDLADHRDVQSLETHTHSVLSAAYAAGIRYFDTARSYGSGERFLGQWLDKRVMSAESVTVSSKWGYRYVADWEVDAKVHEVKDHSLPHLESQYAESRSNLGTHLAVYQIHSATIESGVLDDRAVLNRLAEIRDSGITVGLSTSGPYQATTIRKALAVDVGGSPLFGTVQSTWNLLERSAGAALVEAHEAGVGVIIKESVANGRLTERNPITTSAMRAAFPQHSPDAVAIAAVLEQPWVDAVLSGAATIGQLTSNLGALEVISPVADSLSSMTEDPERYWRTRSELQWN